jgi:trimethylamine:corrinoid methyltransferase-like protein
MLITESELIKLLFTELSKTKRYKALSSDVAELLSLLQERCISDVGSHKLVAMSDYDLQRESVRYVSFVLNEFDKYFERCVARQSRLERVLYVIGNYRGRRTIERAQLYLSSFFNIGLGCFLNTNLIV